MNSPLPQLENLYNTYSPMVYGIALEISPTAKEAEEILVITFQKVYKQNLIQQCHPSICVALINLAIQTAQEQLNPTQLKNNFKLKQFESTPLINQLLWGQTSLEGLSEKNKLTRAEAAKKIREEFNTLRNRKKEGAGLPVQAA